MERASQVARVVRNSPANADVRDMDQIPWDPTDGMGMATYSSVLAWKIPWTEEPSGIQSLGLQRFGHDWGYLAGTHSM